MSNLGYDWLVVCEFVPSYVESFLICDSNLLLCLSPFGKRCAAIHDPRIGGKHASWLPHTETQGNSIETDINVESLYQKRLNEIIYGTPFGDSFDLEKDGWDQLYKVVCSSCDSKKGWVDSRRRSGIHPIYKLQIALAMRGDSNWFFKYSPQHVIHDELCMVLQKSAFRITPNMEAIQIPPQTYNSQNSNHIIVHELAFGPDSEPSVRGVALWFNISEGDVLECTAQQAKRFRFKRTLKKDEKVASVFDSLENFSMIRPRDSQSFDLATAIIKHQLSVLQAERISNMKDRYDSLKELKEQENFLLENFENLRRHWFAWGWPINKGREHVDKTTEVPSVDGEYVMPDSLETMPPGEEETLSLGSEVQRIWVSFLEENFESTDPVSDPFLLGRSYLDNKSYNIFVMTGEGKWD